MEEIKLDKRNILLTIIAVLIVICIALTCYCFMKAMPYIQHKLNSDTTASTEIPPTTTPKEEASVPVAPPSEPVEEKAVEKENPPVVQPKIISEAEAINLVNQAYQQDGHIVIMSQNDNAYTIGCFMSMYYDEETNEPMYNMQEAEYSVNKYSGQVTTIKNNSEQLQTSSTTISYDQAVELIEQNVNPKSNYDSTNTNLMYLDNGTITVNNTDCYSISFGEDTPDKFTASRHFIVPLNGNSIFEENIFTLEYDELWTN